MMDVVKAWVDGQSFANICKMTSIYEGSMVRCIRRLEELLRQMCSAAKAIGNSELEAKFTEGLFVCLIHSDSANILLFVFFRNREDQTRYYLCSLTLLIKLSISFLLSFGRQQKTNLVFFLFCSMCLFVCSIVICY